MRRLHLILLSTAMAVAVVGSPVAVSALPGTVQVEGVLRSSAGGSSADGNYTLTFAIYDKQAGGTALWTEAKQLTVLSGRFRHALGATSALSAKVTGNAGQLWLGVRVDQDPELLRQPIHAVLFALRSAAAKHADTADSAKSADTAKVAAGLQCSGCVSTTAMKFDGDIDLQTHGLVAAKVAAKTFVGAEFIGDGSKLTGLPGAKLVGAKCAKGKVVAGINADGTLSCVDGAATLPKDGIGPVSNDLLSNKFVYTTATAKAAPIPDNNPDGVTSELVVPDHGIATSLTIAAEVSNSDTSKLSITLTDPAGGQHVLWKNGQKVPVIKAQWPPAQVVSGDLSKWIGQNPKGKWALKVVDGSYKDNKADGAIDKWSVAVEVISNKLVAAKAGFTVQGHLKAAGSFQFPVSEKPPVGCDKDHVGYAYVDPKTKQLHVCNGDEYGKVAIVPKLGEQQNPAASCLDLLTKRPELGKVNGTYWIKPGAKAIQAWCDMTTDGGGYTLYPIDSGKNTCRQSDANSCKDLGMRIVYPRSKAMWTAMLAKYGKAYFTTIPGVYKASNGGNYTNCPMRSSHYGGHCGGWRVADGGRWWLRDSNYSEPNGDYTANCWLSMYNWDVNNIQFNDGNCSYCTTRYVCSTNDKK